MRRSGIELLRIFAALAVIILHYDGLATEMGGGNIENMLMLDFLRSFTICAVDVFVAISGYFLIKSQKRTLGKILSLLFQVTLVNSTIYFVSVAFGHTSFNIGDFAFNVVPHNYFVILYLVMYVFSPYVNLLIGGLSNLQRKYFLCLSILLYSVYPSLVNLSGELFHISWFGLNSIGAWGSQKGFTIVNFLLLYSVGACLRLGVFKPNRNVCQIFLCGLLIFGWYYVCECLGARGGHSAWEYHNPLVILLSVSLLNYFDGISLQSTFINKTAKAAFMCFLTHQYFLVHMKVEFFIKNSILLMLVHIVCCLIIIYAVSWIVYFIYYKIFDPVFERLDKYYIKY